MELLNNTCRYIAGVEKINLKYRRRPCVQVVKKLLLEYILDLYLLMKVDAR